ncbi:MAG: hypothetical protein IKB40_07445 [Paludibacteraceae bacterium]|nr:hypothetical protein [Paludibacteraceae bacterium]
MKNFSLKVTGKRREAKDKRLQRCLENTRKASYSLEAAMPQCKVYGVRCKGEENNPTPHYTTLHHTIPSYTTLHHTTQREATGEVILLIILCHDLAIAKRALHIIQRDLGSQLLQVEQCDTVVGAYLSTLQGFNPSECLSFYHYHLDRSLGHQAQVWITTKGGKL